MFRLIRWLFSLVVSAIVIWFAVSVPLGDKTLWQHVRAIFGTKEAKDLARGVEEESKKVADKLRDRLGADAGAEPAPRHSRQPLDPVEEGDRKQLDKLVKDKTAHHK